MKIEKEKSIDILFIGPGMDQFKGLLDDYIQEVEKQGFQCHYGVGFSAPDITNIIITFGVSLFAGVSGRFIYDFLKAVFSRKNEVEKEGIKSNITVNITTNNGTVVIEQDTEKDCRHLNEPKELNEDLKYKLKDVQIFQTPSESELIEKVKEIKEKVDLENKNKS